MIIRFPDISVGEWNLLEPFIYLNSAFEFQCPPTRHSWSVSPALEMLPLAVRFQLEALQRSCDDIVSGNGDMLCLADVLSTYGDEVLPLTCHELTYRILRGRYCTTDVTSELTEKLLQWSEMTTLWELFESNHLTEKMLQWSELTTLWEIFESIHLIPPELEKKIDVARKVHGDDNAILVLILYYRLACKAEE